jgi:archaellum biogenesis protein FlaJ (TadC family)
MQEAAPVEDKSRKSIMIDGRTLNIIGMILFILVFITDKFIYKVPSSVYIVIMLVVAAFMFGGIWLQKQELKKGK